MSALELPRGWLREKLSKLIKPRGEKVSPKNHSGLKFIGMDHVEAHTTKIIGSQPAESMKSNAARFSSGDVLYGRLRPYLNKVAHPNFDGLASAEFIVFPDTELLKSAFLKYRLSAADFVSFSSHLNEGDRPRVSFDQIGDFDILLPPPKEQLRIVAKIEELFSELDKGIESLKTAREQLKVYRQALLKHAFEGKLTAQWREENKDKLETADALLKRIQSGRAQRYQQQLADSQQAVKVWEACGKKSKKPSKPHQSKRLRQLTAEELAELPPLPKEWGWEKMGELAREIVVGYVGPVTQHFVEKPGVRFISTTHIGEHKFYNSETRYVSDQFDSENRKSRVVSGDIIIARHGDSGKACGIPSFIDRAQVSNAVILRVDQDNTDMDFLLYAINNMRALLQKRKVGGVFQVVNTESMSNFPLPVIPLKEQEWIVNKLQERFSVVDEIEKTIDDSLRESEALRQSILKKAFSGQLLPQDPTDEPTSTLLERIKMAKALQANAAKVTKAELRPNASRKRVSA